MIQNIAGNTRIVAIRILKATQLRESVFRHAVLDVHNTACLLGKKSALINIIVCMNMLLTSLLVHKWQYEALKIPAALVYWY